MKRKSPKKSRTLIALSLLVAGIVLSLTNVSEGVEPMRHPQTGEPGVWSSKQESRDALLAHEIALARAEAWEAVAIKSGNDAKLARQEISELRETVVRIPGLVEQEKKKAFKEGKSAGAMEALTTVGVIVTLVKIFH